MHGASPRIYRRRDPPNMPPSRPLKICRPSWLPTVRTVCLAIVSTIPCRRQAYCETVTVS